MSSWVPLVCAFAAVVLYANTLDLQFCFDDSHAIRDNQDVTNLSSWLDLLKDDFWGAPLQHKLSCKSYRPLCVATFRLNYLLHELQPMGYHLVNVLLHGAVCYLYVQLCGVIFSEVWPALIAGLLFAVHPIHTEAVSGVVGRTELLGGLFFLLTLLSYRRATMNQDSKGGLWFVVSMATCLLSVLSKEQGITVVAVCVAYDMFIVSKFDVLALVSVPQRQGRVAASSSNGVKKQSTRWVSGGVLSSGTLARCVVFGIFGVCLAAIRLWMAGGSPKFYWVDLGAHGMSSSFQRGLNYLYLVFVNSWLLLSPNLLLADWTGGTLTLITSLSDPRNLLTAATFLTLATLGLTALWSTAKASGKGHRTKTLHRQVILALAMTVFPFIPASNLFFPVGFVVAERVLYLPSMGFCLLVSIGCWHLATHRSLGSLGRTLVKIGVMYLVCISALKSAARNRDWYSNETLAAAGLKIVQTNGKFYTMLGKEYRNRGEYNTTEKLYRMASAIEPQDALMKRKLGSILEALEKYPEAETVYSDITTVLSHNGTRSLTLNRVGQSNVNIYAEYALLLRKNHKFLLSNVLYREALRLEPTAVHIVEQNVEMLIKNMGHLSEAVDLIDQCLKTSSNPARLYNLKASLLSYMGQREGAIEAWKKALSFKRDDLDLLINLGFILHDSEDKRHLTESITVNKKVLSLKPRSHHAALHLAESYNALGDKPHAEDMYRRVLSITPKSSKAILKLGKLLVSQGRFSEAVQMLKNGVQHYPYLVEGWQLLEECYTALGNSKKTGEMSRQIASKMAENKHTAMSLVEKALGEVERGGEVEVAQRYLRRAIDQDPENIEAKVQLGRLITEHQQLALYQQARELSEEVLLSDPNNEPAILNLGSIHSTLNHANKAAHHFKTFLRNHPNDTLVLHKLGVLLARRTERPRCREAVGYLLRLQQLRPLTYQEEVMLTSCYMHLGQTEHARGALKHIQSSYTDMASRIALTKLFSDI